MPVINPNTTDMEDLTPIEPNTYRARIAAARTQNSREKGNPMVVPTFAVRVGDKERTRKSFLNITGAGSFSFDQLLRAVGMAQLADRYRKGEDVPFDTDSLVGQELNVIITMGSYNGQPRDEISGYLPL